MTGRVMIVTGGNSGIGYEVAKYLCEGGNDVVLACRDTEKGEVAVQKIKQDLPHSLVSCMKLDLSSTTSVREFVQEFTKKKRKLSVLVNNAGVILNQKDLTRRTTKEGFELTMATNFLGPFLLTNLLLDYMIQTGAIMGESRIVNITCGMHDHVNHWSTRRLANLDPKNLQLDKERTYSSLQAYKNSKLCMVLFTYLLAERLRTSNVKVTVNVVNPGVVPHTQLSRHSSKLSQVFSRCCLHSVLGCAHMTKSIRKAANDVAMLAISDKFEGRSGKYFIEGVEDRSSVESYDADLQKSVWRQSAKLVGLKASMYEDFDDISIS